MSNSSISRGDNYYKQIFRWISKISFSVLDQGLFSGSNFIVVFLLGRWLNEKEYGAYGIVFTVFLFIMGFFTALILEPMNVYGPSYFSGKLLDYKNKLLYLQCRFSLILLALLLIITSLLFVGKAENEMIVTMIGLSIAIPGISFYWFARQACYLDSNPKIAVLGSVSYAVTLLASMISLYQIRIISGPNIFLLMGFSGLIGGIVIGLKIQFKFKSLIKVGGSLELDEIIKKHWNYGKWVLGTAIANGIASLSFPIIVGLFLGLSEAGAYRAMQNLFSPLQQIMAALSLLLLPWVSSQFNKGRKHLQKKMILGIGFVFIFISIIYLFPLNIFGRQVIGFYKKDFYQGFLWIIPLFSIYSLIIAFTSVFGIVIRALERSDIVMRSKIWSAISVLSLGIFLSQQFKLLGIMMVLIFSVVLEGVILIIWELKNAKKMALNR